MTDNLARGFTNRRYVSGETYKFWGAPVSLVFMPDRSRSLSIADGKMVLVMPGDSDTAAREKYLTAQMKMRLMRAIAMRMPFWEHRMGLYARSFTVRNMKSRWGSCNILSKRLTFNLQLIELDPVCLDYVIVHELAHLKHRNHNKAFWSLVGSYLPDWKKVREVMNHADDV